MILFFSIPLALLSIIVTGTVVALLIHLAPEQLFLALQTKETWYALRLTLGTSLISLSLALLLGVPSAYLLARCQFPGKVIIETLLDIPLVTPPLVAGVGLLFLMGHNSPLGQGLDKLGIELLFSPSGIILAQTYISASIIVRCAQATFSNLDPDYRKMASTLGLTPIWTFLLIEIPMSAKGLVSAMILGWARALGEFGATLMLAGATRMYTETLPMAVYLNIASGESDLAVACAVILLGLAFILLIATRLLKAMHPTGISYA